MPGDENRGTVAITGAGSGIGEDAAAYLNQLGYRVVACVMTDADGNRLRAKVPDPDRLHTIAFDVTDAAAVADAAKQIATITDGGGLRALFSNAGIAASSSDVSCEGCPIDDQRRLMDVNHFGAVRVIQALLPQVRAARGTVVVNTAMMAHVMIPFNGGYGASKCALDGWTDALRREVAPLGVRVAKIHAGAVATGLTTHGHGGDQPPPADTPYKAQAGVTRHFHDDLANKANDPKCSPRRVSEAVAEAIEADRPKVAYNVGGGSGFLYALGNLPQRLQDRALGLMVKRMN